MVTLFLRIPKINIKNRIGSSGLGTFGKLSQIFFQEAPAIRCAVSCRLITQDQGGSFQLSTPRPGGRRMRCRGRDPLPRLNGRSRPRSAIGCQGVRSGPPRRVWKLAFSGGVRRWRVSLVSPWASKDFMPSLFLMM